MKKTIGIITLLALLITVLFSATSCGQKVPQEEYESIVKELSESKDQIATLQGKIAEAESVEARYAELSAQLAELKSQNDANLDEIKALEAQREELSTQSAELKSQNDAYASEIENLEAQYEELKKQYDEATGPPGEILEKDIEEILFALINQERTNNGEDELLWSTSLFKAAQTNNRRMTSSREYESYDLPSVQEVFWATGYDTAESIANAALTIWKNNTYQYQQKILTTAVTYGAVDAYESDGIFYITYIASVSY